MHRKEFISLGSAAFLPFLPPASGMSSPTALIPPYLRPGETIGITSPAGYITEEEIRPSVLIMESWGYTVKAGHTIGRRFFGFGGTDNDRAKDMQDMLDDPSISAILCARGGYGMVRIIDRLDFTRFLSRPKWIIGFSDITVLHSHLLRQFNVASIHAKMCNSFPDSWEVATDIQKTTIQSIRQALAGEKTTLTVTPSGYNRPGKAEGMLTGGNLKTLESLAGTRSDINTKNKILFVEDTGEYLYSIDRMFFNLQRTGKLAGLKGLIIGGFKVKPDDAGEEFGIPLEDIILDRVKNYSFPVCFDFPVGHQPNNFALKCGVQHRLSVNELSCTLEEIRP